MISNAHMAEAKDVADEYSIILVLQKHPEEINVYFEDSEDTGVETPRYWQRNSVDVIKELATMQLVKNNDDVGLSSRQKTLIVEGIRSLDESSLDDLYDIVAQITRAKYNATTLSLDVRSIDHKIQILLLNAVILSAKMEMARETIWDIIQDKDKDNDN